MKKSHLSFIGIIFMLCVLFACKKDKDIAPDDIPPVTNDPNPNPIPNPTDSTPKPPPVFTDFFPASANIGDTITLTGKNLGTNLNVLTVRFGEVEARVVSASDTTVKAIVPDNIVESKTNIEIIFGGDKFLSPGKIFNLKPPVIESISLTSGFEGQFITIKGKGFRINSKFGQVSFGDKLIPQVSTIARNGALEIEVPPNTPAGKYAISVSIAGLTAYAADSFTVIVPVITNVSPATGNRSTLLTITGENFIDPNGGNTIVTFNYWPDDYSFRDQGSIRSITNNEIKVMVPTLTAGQYKVVVLIRGSRVSAANPFTYIQ